MFLFSSSECFVLQKAYMQSHTPTPPPRKIEVDLSDILINDEANRAQKAAGHPTPLPAFWRDPALPAHPSHVSSAEWTNIIFAIGASLVAIFCTLATFDDLEQFRRNVYRTSTLYASPRFSANRPQHFIGTTAGAIKRQSKRARPAQFQERPTVPMQQGPNSSSTFNTDRFFDGQNLFNDGLAAAHSLSSVPTAFPEQTGSGSEGSGTPPPPVKSVRSPGRISRGNARDTAALARKTPFGQPAAGSRIATALQERGMDKSSSRKTLQTDRIAGNSVHTLNTMNHSMHSIGGSLGMTHNIGAADCMHMQHGMLGEPSVIGALHGLNNAGLGGGSGHHHANAHR